MNDTERKRIDDLKASGKTANMISKELNISLNTVKTYLRRRRQKVVIKTNIEEIKPVDGKCLYCGSDISNGKTKHKKFCSDKCRMKWWNEHRELVKKNVKVVSCLHCHKEFKADENKVVKFCSHDCYVKHRYGR